MLANWSRQRFWDCVVSAQRDFFEVFLFPEKPEILVFLQKTFIFHVLLEVLRFA